ncbi:hypothetical protein [Campylobacter coli]|uniref:hypothetical protein n=1 Tax=Campylobacter coli TaxID=195 RepID=UPI000AB534DF|nr:hypothetical protein [Campylobacter coli]
MYYKEHKYQKDNLLITNLYLNDTLYQNEQGLDKLELSKNDLFNLNDINVLNTLKQDFSKDYEFKECEIRLGMHLLKLIFVIPKNIAKVYKSAYKEFKNKDLGAGYFTQLHEYDKDYRENENIIHHRVFLAPAKMQKIGFEIAKGLDEWLDNENVCCFNVNTQEIIPDNVIRIQTQDGSGEFIEIIFDEFKEWEKSSSGAIKPLFTPLEGIVEDISNSLENVSIIGDALAMLGAVKNPKNAKNIIKKKSKYATKQEVIEVLKNKYNLKTSKELGLGRSKNVFWVKDNKQIKEIWEEITDEADILKDINQDKLGGTIKMRKLDDQTIIQYKKASKSGGETIEVNSNKPRGNLRTIHIENGVKNEV